MKKFTDSILGMVSSVGAFGYIPSLKDAWRWLKFVIEDYVGLKKET